MHVVVPHRFAKEEAARRLKLMLAEAKTKLGDKATVDKEEWSGDILRFALTAQGQQISGEVEVQEKQFVIDAKLPLMLRLFEGRIEKAIAGQIQQAGGAGS